VDILRKGCGSPGNVTNNAIVPPPRDGNKIAQRFPGLPIPAAVARVGVVERWVDCNFLNEPLGGGR
jgi:hypothetical protein